LENMNAAVDLLLLKSNAAAKFGKYAANYAK
jgi:hypothetical protein